MPNRLQNSEKKRFDYGFVKPEDLDVIELDSINTEESSNLDQDAEEQLQSDDYFDGYFDALDEYDSISTSISDTSILQKREDTRGRLATIYTIATFFVFFFALLLAMLDGILRQTSIVENISTIIPVISGVFLGTLGFVLGYYFRKEDE